MEGAIEFAASREFARYGVMRCLLTRARILRAADHEGAEADAQRALAMSSAGGLHLETLEGLELLATFAIERGEAEVAARLLGAAANVRAQTGVPLSPSAQPEMSDAMVALVGGTR